MAKDYYKILGVEKSATADELKKAYRKLAHEHHPDKASDPKKRDESEKKFKEINEAYQVLSNSEKRQQYDQYGSTFEDAARNGGGFGGAQGFSGFQGGNVDFEDLSELFGSMFGGGGQRRQRSNRGRDIQVTITLQFSEAVFGVERKITLYKNIKCDTCKGNGADPKSKVITCDTCKGKGQVEVEQRTIFGTFRTASICQTCHGEGSRPEKTCSTCSGTGSVKQTVEIPLRIPGGVSDGETLEVTGEGEAGGRGGQAGDLYVTVRVETDKRFERRGDDILSKLNLSFSEAALGTKKDVETVDGAVTLTIPEGTQTGQTFRLAGRGVTHLRSKGRGDHLVTVTVLTPTKLSKRQRELLKELDG